MRRYLSTLHKRSDRHKKHFALAVSGGFTLCMFAIWLSVRYSPQPIVAEDGRPALAATHEASPLESFSNLFSSLWQDITSFTSHD